MGGSFSFPKFVFIFIFFVLHSSSYWKLYVYTFTHVELVPFKKNRYHPSGVKYFHVLHNCSRFLQYGWYVQPKTKNNTLRLPSLLFFYAEDFGVSSCSHKSQIFDRISRKTSSPCRSVFRISRFLLLLPPAFRQLM